MTQDEIFTEVKSIIIELFDTDPNLITREAHLFVDLDLDSIDAVDMVVLLQKRTGKKVKPEDFKNVRTVQDVVDALDKLLNNQN